MTRTQELREDVTRWLESDDGVQTRLGSDGAIVPAARAGGDDSSPQLAVAAAVSSTGRQNDQRSVELQVRVATSATYQWVDETAGGLDELYRLHDAVGDVLTTHRDGWSALGVQADDEIAPNDTVNRFLGATSFAFERTETHPVYQ